MTDWLRIVDEHGELVWRTAYRLVGNTPDALDCCQKTFLGAIEMDRREEVRDWPALLRRLAMSRALDVLRSRYRRRKRIDAATDVARLCGDGPDPGQRAESAELAERLRVAMAELPSRQADAFCLCCVEGLSYAEAAERLGLHASSVGALVHRARKRLRRRLAAVAPRIGLDAGEKS